MVVFAKLAEALNEPVCFLEPCPIRDMLVMTEDDQQRFRMWLCQLLLFIGTALIAFTASSDLGSKISFGIVLFVAVVKVAFEEGNDRLPSLPAMQFYFLKILQREIN